MKKFLVRELAPDSYFSEPLYLEDGFILAAPEMPVTADLINTLKEWDCLEVYSEGSPIEAYTGDILEKLADMAELEEISDSTEPNPDVDIMRAMKFYSESLRFVESLFTQAVIKDTLDYNTIANWVMGACKTIREDRPYILRILRNIQTKRSGNYLASHTLKSTILSIIIGLYLKMPTHRLTELGVASLVHEIGMTKLSPQTYLSSRPLDPKEKEKILTHPIRGYNLLNTSDFPMAVCLAALEHHERENGSGYPRNLTSERISQYAKIIAVACSYEALSAHRPHKEAKDGYTGILELLRNEGKQYDDTVVRALVYSLSLYPVGLHVLLSNGQKAQVIDVNPEDPKFPIVKILDKGAGTDMEMNVQTSQTGVSIVRPLTAEERI
ncbi:MAG: HD-GYP domain-containing protein [Treponema sp.]|nr:HD-GYP domain-containing protein [Treponema sp.]